jgi:hypothetical protein
LFLSKFDEDGLKALGFGGFSEAFNVLALSVRASPASLKNYRDEFDPYFPNPRKGWHKRPMRQYCKSYMEISGDIEIEDIPRLMDHVALACEVSFGLSYEPGRRSVSCSGALGHDAEDRLNIKRSLPPPALFLSFLKKPSQPPHQKFPAFQLALPNHGDRPTHSIQSTPDPLISLYVRVQFI